MRIFILEDDHYRIAKFRNWFDGHDITQVDSCASVDAFKPPYDVVFFDHDLGGRQMTAHEDNGHRFAGLVKGRIEQPTIAIVHTFNPDGALNIKAELHLSLLQSQWTVYVAPFMGPEFRSLVSILLNKQRPIR